jgi:hypothetical protein
MEIHLSFLILCWHGHAVVWLARRERDRNRNRELELGKGKYQLSEDPKTARRVKPMSSKTPSGSS